MFYSLFFDANGNITGSNSYADQPKSYAANEVACTQSQAENPSLYQVVNGVIQENLSAFQTAQKALLLESYQTAIDTPVSFKNAAGVTSTYPSGDTLLADGSKAKDKLAQVLSAGSAGWTLGKWLDINNVAQAFTFADLEGLAAAMEAAMTIDWSDLVTKMADVDAATTVSEVEAIAF